MVNATPRPLRPPEMYPVPIVQEAGWAPEPVWTSAGTHPLGFDPRTVQPVASYYTDCIITGRLIREDKRTEITSHDSYTFRQLVHASHITNAEVNPDYLKSGVYHLLATCHVNIKVRMKFSALEC